MVCTTIWIVQFANALYFKIFYSVAQCTSSLFLIPFLKWDERAMCTYVRIYFQSSEGSGSRASRICHSNRFSLDDSCRLCLGPTLDTFYSILFYSLRQYSILPYGFFPFDRQRRSAIFNNLKHSCYCSITDRRSEREKVAASAATAAAAMNSKGSSANTSVPRNEINSESLLESLCLAKC